MTTLLLRLALFAGLWWLVTEGAAGSWMLGVPAVVVVTVISMVLVPSTPLAWSELLRFIPFFLLQSLLGGVDVARRALHPRLPIAPSLVDYPLRLPTELPRVVMMNTISLLPGTLSVEMAGDRLTIHALNRREDYQAELEELEERVARLFIIHLPAIQGGFQDEALQEHPVCDRSRKQPGRRPGAGGDPGGEQPGLPDHR